MTVKFGTIQNTENKCSESGVENRMILTNCDIDDVAQKIVNRYLKLNGYQNMNIDISELLAVLFNLKIVYHTLSNDGSILGLFSPVPMTITVNSKNESTLVELDGKTIVIDESLLKDSFIGRKNFTIAHEGAHYIFSLYDNIRQPLTIRTEKQVDTLAACLLMPQDSVRYIFWRFYGTEHLERITPFQDELFYPFEAMADYFKVSKQALAIRLKNMGLVDEIVLSASIEIIKEDF